jgi:hypothetical protein
MERQRSKPSQLVCRIEQADDDIGDTLVLATPWYRLHLGIGQYHRLIDL